MGGKLLYTTWGPIRGDCGHAHRTFTGAEACIARDQRGCRSQGGHSDRHIREIASRRDLASYDVTRGPGRRVQ